MSTDPFADARRAFNTALHRDLWPRRAPVARDFFAACHVEVDPEQQVIRATHWPPPGPRDPVTVHLDASGAAARPTWPLPRVWRRRLADRTVPPVRAAQLLPHNEGKVVSPRPRLRATTPSVVAIGAGALGCDPLGVLLGTGSAEGWAAPDERAGRLFLRATVDNAVRFERGPAASGSVFGAVVAATIAHWFVAASRLGPRHVSLVLGSLPAAVRPPVSEDLAARVALADTLRDLGIGPELPPLHGTETGGAYEDGLNATPPPPDHGS